MKPYLLDVNVLIALLDPSHVHHDRAHDWFGAHGQDAWLSCPTTQNGTIRVVSHPKYSNTQPVPAVIESLESLTRVGGHRFIEDAVSLLAHEVRRSKFLTSSQVTDTYLLHLAVAADARLATFDRRMATEAVVGGADAVFFLP